MEKKTKEEGVKARKIREKERKELCVFILGEGGAPNLTNLAPKLG